MTRGYHKHLEVYVMAVGTLHPGAFISGPEAGVCVSAKLKLARHCFGQSFLLWTRD